MLTLISRQGAMTAHAETGEQWNLKLLAFSPPEQSDYAIMQASGAGFDARTALTPTSGAISERGQKLLYAGYPHGIDPLLVHSSKVTAPLKDNAFFFSGMVHGGNFGAGCRGRKSGYTRHCDETPFFRWSTDAGG
jgi:hypothetical protein